jgi:prevent-host-death family protein
MSLQSWTVSDAKAHLSEILRLACTEGPQQIGERKPCIVIPAAEWERLTGNHPNLGTWLIDNLAILDETIKLPSRSDGNRSIPFEEEA